MGFLGFLKRRGTASDMGTDLKFLLWKMSDLLGEDNNFPPFHDVMFCRSEPARSPGPMGGSNFEHNSRAMRRGNLPSSESQESMAVDYVCMSVGEAMTRAKGRSNMTNAEIAAGMGIGEEVVKKWFNPNDNYWPSAINIPSLCHALGNSILLDWLNSQVRPDTEELLRRHKELVNLAKKIVKAAGQLMAIKTD